MSTDIRLHCRLCSAGREVSSSSSWPTHWTAVEAAAAQLACAVITAPELLIQLPAAARKQLTDPGVLSMLMTALHCLASHQHQTIDTATASSGSEAKANNNGGEHSFSSGITLRQSALVRVQLDSREAALIALGNLAGMLCGEPVSKPTQVCMCHHANHSNTTSHKRFDGNSLVAQDVGEAALGFCCVYLTGNSLVHMNNSESASVIVQSPGAKLSIWVAIVADMPTG